MRRTSPGDAGLADATPRLDRSLHEPRGHVGWVVAGSLATGPVAAALFAAAPFIPPTEAAVTGAVLLGLALGWALLAVLSVRWTDQPQRWAAAPAAFMGLSGLLLMAFGAPVHEAIVWVWPPALLALVVWMHVRARRHLRSPSRRWVVYPVLAALALASVGGGYEAVRAAADAAAGPLPGRMVDVGGHRLHLSCTGSGSPTVVLEPGAGMTSSDLWRITPVVARETRVCIYDRAGRGWSEPAGTAQSAAQIATDLHTLLHAADVGGPYVLAGHSFGGLYALAFTARYPDEVAGMVLVDSTAPARAVTTSATRADPRDSYDLMSRASAVAAMVTRLGVGRLVGLTASHLRSTIDEYAQASASIEEAVSLRGLGSTPLVVLTAGIGSQPGWSEEQDALATLSANSVHRVIQGTDHAGLVVEARGAAATTRAILDVVAFLRTATPLAR